MVCVVFICCVVLSTLCLCDELITCPGESYHVYNKIGEALKAEAMTRSGLELIRNP
jgi:hypothetical protein